MRVSKKYSQKKLKKVLTSLSRYGNLCKLSARQRKTQSTLITEQYIPTLKISLKNWVRTDPLVGQDAHDRFAAVRKTLL